LQLLEYQPSHAVDPGVTARNQGHFATLAGEVDGQAGTVHFATNGAAMDLLSGDPLSQELNITPISDDHLGTLKGTDGSNGQEI
jgi:hypothetical protein